MKRSIYFVTCCIILGILTQGCNSKNNKNEIILADASVVWWMAPGTIAISESIYEKNEIKIKRFDVQTGLASKNAVLSGSADIGLVASTPLATGAFNKDNLIVLCSYVKSSNLLSLITRDAQDTTLYSIPEPPIAVVKGTISELYLYNYLKKHDADNLESFMSNQLNIKPADVPNSMSGKSGANSASIWEPFATMTANNGNYKINRDPGIYNHRIYIVTTPQILEKKRDAIQRFVKSFEMACQSIKENPQKAKETLKSIFDTQELSMNELWDLVDFSVDYDYDNMQELILRDAQSLFELKQTPKDKSGQHRNLTINDVKYYFNHDFKPLSQ